MNIDGVRYVCAGTSTTYKGTVVPANANNKGVIWKTSPENIPGVTIDAKSGKLTVAAGTASGSFTLACHASDSNSYATVTVRIINPASSYYVNPISYSGSFNGGGTEYASGNLKKATLYTTEAAFWSGEYYGTSSVSKTWKDAEIKLNSSTNSPAGLVWSSSKPGVATVDQTGKVTAVAPGTTTVTASANDSSGKKASVTIKVINPASGVTIASGAPRAADFSAYQSYQFYNKITFPNHGDANQFHYVNDEYNFEPRLLSIGKSAQNKAVLGDAFGTPTVKKVTWGVDVYVYKQSGSGSSATYTRQTGIESEIYSKKLITVSGSGKLTVMNTARMKEINDYYYVFAFVNAYTTDGTDLAGSIRYYITSPITKLSINGKSTYKITIEKGNNETDRYLYVLTKQPKDSRWFYINPRYMAVTAQSSNPQVAGPQIAVKDNHTYIEIISGLKKGRAVITVKAADGSGKSCKIIVTVK